VKIARRSMIVESDRYHWKIYAIDFTYLAYLSRRIAKTFPIRRHYSIRLYFAQLMAIVRTNGQIMPPGATRGTNRSRIQINRN